MVRLGSKPVFDCPIDVRPNKFIGVTVPFSWSFAMSKLPPGQKVFVPRTLGDLIVTTSKSPNDGEPEELEEALDREQRRTFHAHVPFLSQHGGCPGGHRPAASGRLDRACDFGRPAGALPFSFSRLSLSTEGCLIALWALIPPFILLAVASFTDLQLFTCRYFICSAPGVALAAGSMLARSRAGADSALGRVLDRGMRRSTVAMGEHFMRGLYDFRRAVGGVRALVGDSQTFPVLVEPGFIEGDNVSGVLDPRLSEVLLAPLLRYHMPGHLIAVPRTLSEDAESYMEQLFTTTLQDQRQFPLLGAYRAEFYRLWLEGRSRRAGFTSRRFGFYEGYEAILFERNAAP